MHSSDSRLPLPKCFFNVRSLACGILSLTQHVEYDGCTPQVSAHLMSQRMYLASIKSDVRIKLLPLTSLAFFYNAIGSFAVVFARLSKTIPQLLCTPRPCTITTQCNTSRLRTTLQNLSEPSSMLTFFIGYYWLDGLDGALDITEQTSLVESGLSFT